jgi:FixJ family two-component response regulator
MLRLPFSADVPVHVVDDDASVQDALALVLKVEGYAPYCFADGTSFLDAVRERIPACVLLDLHLPVRSGLDVLRDLGGLQRVPQVIVMSGRSDIATAVAAMRSGAADFIEKPFSANAIVERVGMAVAAFRRETEGTVEGLAPFPGGHLLTGRERDVLAQVAYGASNKEAGRRLGISPRTVEVHRARIMDKLGARNAADLMRIVLSGAKARPRFPCNGSGYSAAIDGERSDRPSSSQTFSSASASRSISTSS